MLDRSETAKNLTDESIKKALGSFAESKSMLNTLEKFDQVLNSNKQKATQSQELKSKILSNIESSEKSHSKSFKSLLESKNLYTEISNSLDYVKQELDFSLKVWDFKF